ncbi:MAG: DUF255 domain-containing protein [bacterium]
MRKPSGPASEHTPEYSIVWQEWSSALFSYAKAKDKLIFLYLQAPWCQWCRRLESESLTDPEVSLLISRYFIPLQVDTDVRPDLNLRYTMGGWPSIVVLTPEGEVITGGTFLSKENLKKLLAHCLFLYRSRKKELRERLKQVKEKSNHHHIGEGGENLSLPPDILQRTIEFLKADFDPVYGGFGRTPKFPHYEAIELSLLATRLFHDPDMEEILTRTLDGMVEGELFDQEEGGFFRCSQNRDWSSPQYEKMLADNAWLLRNYLGASLVTASERYKNIAQSILHYLDTHLFDPDRGAFFGSQRADEQYYQKSGTERTFYPAPPYGKAIYTDWNALTVSACLRASAILGREIYLDRAKKTMDYLWQHCATGDLGMLHAADLPHDTTWRLLQDQISTARALLDCYQVFGDDSYLSSAALLAQVLSRHFYDDRNGGFWDRMDTKEPSGRLKERVKPILDNSLSAEFFLKFGVLTQNPGSLTIARHTLTFFSQDYPRYGIFASYYALACYQAMHPAVLVIVLGRREDPLTRTFLHKTFARYEPRKVIKLLDLDQHPEMIQLLQQSGHKAPRGYLYIGQNCQLETDNIERLIQAIDALSQTKIA